MNQGKPGKRAPKHRQKFLSVCPGGWCRTPVHSSGTSSMLLLLLLLYIYIYIYIYILYIYIYIYIYIYCVSNLLRKTTFRFYNACSGRRPRGTPPPGNGAVPVPIRLLSRRFLEAKQS